MVSIRILKRIYQAVRGYLGGIAMVLGILGFFFMAIGVPISIFGAHFWVGMGFRESLPPSPSQLEALINQSLWWAVIHRLLPLFVISSTLVGYGFYEAYVERVGMTR
ncbi:MAG: hypothetical protein JWM68_3294 [Verrucomicrobiales bacterium]|nr:hypothetical protein [Verrucomicrobiales bacterium]